jgi:CRISPR-associated endonuclease Csn1
MEKILGLDLGTNSIGWALRNTSLLGNQFEKYGVITFQKGIGEVKGIEFSYAAERTKNRSLRRRYQAHKYKLWATLEVLIKQGYCPLSLQNLDKWRKYEKGVGRTYPIDDISFNNWIKLDFNGDSKPDYISPYQLRLELVTDELDLAIEENRYKIGRALYHIAQHRGFKSSKKAQDKDEAQNVDDLIGAEKKRAKFIEDLLTKYNVKTVGAAFACEEKNQIRIRRNLHQHVLRKQLQNEVKEIFSFQKLSFEDMFQKVISKSTIFWQRPLRSQKGSVGKCTLEPSKFRCPVSHPAFEEFRALSFINTIEYRHKEGETKQWDKLPKNLRELIYKEKFFRTSITDFDFIEIRKLIYKHNGHDKWELNYKDHTNVSASPVSARLKDLFGDDWKDLKKFHSSNEKRKKLKDFYDIEDVWHVLFSFDDEEDVRVFASDKLKLDEQTEKFVSLWYKMPVAYSMLSLKAINNILPFLQEGMIYTEAVLLAKVPEVLGSELWQEHHDKLKESIKDIIRRNKEEKFHLVIVNSLIGRYKALEPQYKFAERDFEYRLKDDDKRLTEEVIIEAYGSATWLNKDEQEKAAIKQFVFDNYQSFFKDKKREFKKLPHLLDSLKKVLGDTFNLSESQLKKLYHPSQINIYPPAKERFYKKYNGYYKLLESPKTGAFKNPMAMRTLYEMRTLINHLITTGDIDEETRIVVEIARELNDANMRWAIETYQRRRQEENKEFANAIVELLKEYPSTKASAESDDDIDKFRLWFEQLNDELSSEGKTDYAKHDWNNRRSKVYKGIATAKEMIEKYRLWTQQDCQCIYTGKIIPLTDLFSPNNTDFEHTLPRSISFDNSLANLTVCDFRYNRNIKRNRIPFNLENYEEDAIVNGQNYTAIKPRLEKWHQKVEELKANIEFWRKKSKQATAKEEKDKAIRQKHLWQFELNYWQNKVNRFTIKEVKSGFKNSQLIDTQIISKYAFHFLKTAFNKVYVQKGSVTSDFRKIYGLQPKDEKKDRRKHSHHAKDAAVLTLIPVGAKREEILQKAYKHEEKYHQQYNEIAYGSFKTNYVERIEDDILIHSITKDQALTPGKKRVRVRGKKIFYRDKDGLLVEQWSKGDSIRGQLHLDTFYGKIRPAKYDEVNKPLKDDAGNWIYHDKNEGFRFVVRKEVNKDLKVDAIVDPNVQKIFVDQMAERSLDKTLKEDGSIWMLNKKGKKVNRIRHVRCFADDVTEPLAIKKQTYHSHKEYKNYYWAKNGENYAYALYIGVVKNKLERGFRLLNLFDTAKINQISNGNGLQVEREIVFNKKGDKIPVYTILKGGQKVLFFKNDPEELRDLDKKELSNRLYNIIKFEKDGRIVFGHHLDARSDNQLRSLEAEYGKSIYNGFSSVNFEKPWPKLKLAPSSFSFLVQGKDFQIQTSGEIEILNL